MSHREQQEEETEALRAIFGETYHNITNHPPSFMIKVDENEPQEIPGPIYLKFTLPEDYPDETPLMHIVSKAIPLKAIEEMKNHLKEMAEDFAGSPMIFSLVDAARDWMMNADLNPFQETDSNAQDVQDNSDNDTIQCKINAKSINLTQTIHKGGWWKFVIGLVGKPSAGKSTFFNAATCSEKAKVAAHPFTTIDPNIASAFCSIKCPCMKIGNQCNAEFGHTLSGERNVPVLIKDVAGLVPGAADGKGKGNRFLNDLCDADVLIHIVDVSGYTDEKGESTSGYDPRNDIEWLPNEIFRWIYDNIASKWDSIVRRPHKLIDMFTGYHASTSLIYHAFENAGISLRNLEEQIPSWNCNLVLGRLVREFMKLRFPTILALNKADLDTAEENISRIQSEYGMERSVVVSAESAVFVQQLEKDGALEYQSQGVIKLNPGLLKSPDHTVGKFERLKQRVYLKYGFDCVHQAVNLAVESRSPSYAYPVVSIDTLRSYSTSRNDASLVLKQCIMMKPGSTVEDLYEVLRYAVRLIKGKYVRAEGMSFSMDVRHILRKDDVIDTSNCIIQIMTSKRD